MGTQIQVGTLVSTPDTLWTWLDHTKELPTIKNSSIGVRSENYT